MADQSDFKRGQIVVARMAGACVTKITELVGVAFEKEVKPSSLKQKLFVRDHRNLTRIVWKDHKNTAPKIIVELNDHLDNPVSSKTVRR